MAVLDPAPRRKKHFRAPVPERLCGAAAVKRGCGSSRQGGRRPKRITSCFGSSGNNSNFNLGFWSVIFLGVGAPWFAAATWARLTRERRAETWRAEDAHYLELGIPNPHLGMPTYTVPTFPAFVHTYPTMATPAPAHATFVRVDEASAPVHPQGTVQAPQPGEGKPVAR